MFERLSETRKKIVLKKWIQKIQQDETEVTLKKHIVKHAKEIYEDDLLGWAARMHNLLDIFEAKYDLRVSPNLRLQRLLEKYKSNPRRYTAPPRIKK